MCNELVERVKETMFNFSIAKINWIIWSMKYDDKLRVEG